jgi:hypothetical protein
MSGRTATLARLLVDRVAEVRMIIASWLVTLETEAAQTAQRALAGAPGREIRSKSGSRRLVVMTETSQELDAVRQELLDTPGVETADPIASFDDADPGLDLVRWSARSSGVRADLARSVPGNATSAATGQPPQDGTRALRLQSSNGRWQPA